MEPVSSEPSGARFIRESGLAAEFAQLCEGVLAELGLRLVRVTLSGRECSTVQIMAERPDGTISINECAALARNLSPLLDAHDPMPGGYTLEISSPGIDRPLVRPSDFEDWAGYEAKIELTELLEGRKRFKGVLEGFENGEVRVEVDLDQLGRRVLGLPIDLIADAKLVMSENLIREALRRAKKGDKPAGGADNKDGDGTVMDGAEIDVKEDPGNA